VRDKIKWLWRYYRHFPWVLGVLLLGTPIQSVFQVLIPRMLEFTIEYLETGEVSTNVLATTIAATGARFDFAPTVSFAIGFAVLALIATILYALVQTHRSWMNSRLEMEFRQAAFNDVTYKGPNFFNKFRTGDLVTRMTDDVAEKLSWFACSGIFRLYEAVIIVAFIVVMMASIDPMLTLWSAGPLPILIIIFFKSSSLLDKRYDHLQSRISRFNDVMEACFSGIRVVKAYVKEGPQKAKFRDAALDRREAEIAAVKVTAVVDSLYMYIWQFGVIIVLLAGGYMAINATLTVGKLATFIYYIVWLIFPMFDIGQFLVKSRQSGVSIDRLQVLEHVPPMVAESPNAIGNGVVAGDLRFENVNFAFEESTRPILDDVSIDIKAGETVAVVGRVGSGKSWLINLIPRLVNPTGGEIYLDGRELKQYRLEDLRKSIGYVPQEPALFSDTVRNNIVFGREGISQEEIERAVEISQLKEEVAHFSKGLDTRIGTRGVSISGGQKQRLALARALVGSPKILILDDCTSALDSRTEGALWNRLHEVMPGMTSIIITHRPDTLEKADRIVVLDDGRIVETGTHDELVAIERGHYARIYRRYQLEEQVAEG
jgi:ATP-binding cassette subfamily B protein